MSGEVIPESWRAVLEPVLATPEMRRLGGWLCAEEAAGKTIYPPRGCRLKALELTPLESVRVVILGQDPYHGPGQAMGLCFAVPEGEAVPPSLAFQARQRRLLQLGYTDRLLGKLIHRLRATGLWSDALVVVAADRGLRFRDSNPRTPSASKLADLAFTPFFVKLPRQRRGRIVDRRVSTADILPTIADAVSIHIPWRTTGRSALSGGSNPKAVTIGTVSAGYASALAQRGRSLARQTALLGSDWGSRFFGSSPYQGLVGKPIRSLRIAGTVGGVVVDPVPSALLRSLPKGGPLVPSPLFGTTLGVASGASVAVALNGRIVATTRAYKDEGQPVRVGALVPDSAFRPGRNEARMFVVSGSAATPTLRELRVTLLE